MTQTVFRSTHVKNYTVFRNELIDNPDLSWKAKGILLYLLSKPPTWKVMMADIINHAKDGKEAVQSRLKELQQAGYLVKRRVTDPKTGKVIRWETHVFEEPQHPESVPLSPDPENPDSGYPDSGKPAPSKYLSNKDSVTNIDLSLKDQESSKNGEDHSVSSGDAHRDAPFEKPASPVEKPVKAWKPGNPYPTDRKGWIKLPGKKGSAAASARQQACRELAFEIVIGEMVPTIEVEQDEQGDWLCYSDQGAADEGTLLWPETRTGGKFPLRLVRDLAYAAGNLDQTWFNQRLVEVFESNLLRLAS